MGPTAPLGQNASPYRSRPERFRRGASGHEGGLRVRAGGTCGSQAWRRVLAIVLLLLAPLKAVPASALDGAWREARSGDTPASVWAAYDRGEFHAFDPDLLNRVSRPGQAGWVVLRPPPSAVAEEHALTVYPPPLAPVTLYRHGLPPQRMALDDFDAPMHGHGRLAWRLGADGIPSEPLLLRFEADATGATPVRFEWMPWSDYLREDARWLMLSSACFAVMLAMAVMTSCLALMLRDATFAWYAGYVVCYGIIQGIQTGYVFHPMEWTWLAGTASLIGPAAALLSMAFAAAFVARFCELERFSPPLHACALALALGMPPLVVMRISRVDALTAASRALLYPVLIIGAVLLFYAGLVATWRGSRPARYFLLGFTPLLALTAMNSAQASGVLPGMNWLGDAALVAGAFQAIVLALGLADHALAMRHDTDVVRELADVDALTQVLNRRAWSEGLQAVLAADHQPAALLFLDLDHFKALNDCLGHRAGDRALLAVAGALRHELRPQDLLGRYGGEEFVAVLRDVAQAQAVQVAIRLCRRVHRLDIPVDGDGRLLTVSVGIAMRRPDDTPESLVERADHAMYRAKLEGRNRVRVAVNPGTGCATAWPAGVVDDPARER